MKRTKKESEDNTLSGDGVCQIVSQKRLTILKNEPIDPSYPLQNWLTDFLLTLELCEFKRDTWDSLILSNLPSTHHHSIPLDDNGHLDIVAYQKSVFPLPKVEYFDTPQTYLNKLKEWEKCSPSKRELKEVIQNCMDNEIISHTKFKSVEELIKDIESNYESYLFPGVDLEGANYFFEKKHYPSFEDRIIREDSIDNNTSVELLLRVPLEVWKNLLPMDKYRRKTCLSLLGSCSLLRNHLLPLFHMLIGDQFKPLLNGYYAYRKNASPTMKQIFTNDYKYYLQLEDNIYIQKLNFFERSIVSTGTWKIIKEDISNTYYAIEIILEETSAKTIKFQ
eukprot:TRINITY_DN23748_c0_g1_i1.p1 TRINITY_DN23748_c0_g1~~TRINITY_DN23748_c0_g1_i1.p1  ORF type:complete len:335 (-),score=93.25 TRINITY_DN23748_c0_g1_i1:81-1085(-)